MTQNEQIAEYLKQGNRITALEALSRFRCLRLASRVSELKEKGYNIQSETIHDNGKHYSEYYLA
jgi:hypothetical protein